VGDELFQRIGFLEFVEETQAARVAGRRMVGHSEQADLVGQQMPVRIDRDVADIGGGLCRSRRFASYPPVLSLA
jgi:hypothetical protein